MKMRILYLLALGCHCLCFFGQAPNDRTQIIEQLRDKISRQEPLVAHVLVPLCDNEHQGIVPTSPSIGNGLKPNSNLYWATSKGMKRFFKESTDWKFIKVKTNPDTNVLERAIFYKSFTNGAKVYMIADAYRGDRMEACLNDYFNALSSNKNESLIVNDDTVSLFGGADLVAFNGHNGLMDEQTNYEFAHNKTKIKDAVSISCISKSYFKGHYQNTNSYPLVHTTGLLYPGAFVMEGILNAWAMLEDDKACKIQAGKAYYKYKPKSGPNGSQNLFTSGW